MGESSRHDRLRIRAQLLTRMRSFFEERGFLEVETPLADDEIIPELHIEPFRVEQSPLNSLWLQASPELHMKRLLAEGLSAIYQVTRSFRRGERGRLHNPEFTLVEWYRVGDGMQAGITLLEDLVKSIQIPSSSAGADSLEFTRTTYRAAFQQYAAVDPHTADVASLSATANRLRIAIPTEMADADRDEWLNLLLAIAVEPQLGAKGPEILLDFPASQSALARTVVRTDGTEVAERFELYWHGVELANGYCELTDSTKLRARLEAVNRQRATAGRAILPLPERLLAAMESPGLPACSGCALGFDRLAMLLSGADSIDEVMAFPQT